MINECFYGKITTDGRGAILCPVCRRKIRGLRLSDSAEIRNVNLQCNWCKNQFDIEITQTGQRFSSPRH